LSAEQLHLATQACALANNIKVGNYAIIFLLAAALILAVDTAYSRYRPHVFIVSMAGPGAAISWLYKYGKLDTDDPDYPDAKRSVITSLALWSGAFLIVLCVLLWRKTL
jgi:hypothetical protein